MSKIRRTPESIRRRVQIGKQQLWVLVEGKKVDRVFYARLLETFLPESNFEVQRIEEVRIGDKNVSGKPGLLRAHSALVSSGGLTVSQREGRRSICLVMDLDYDELSGAVIRDHRVIYTRARDVEAEVFLNGDLPSALASAFYITDRESRCLIGDARAVFSHLSGLWREWITLGALSAGSGVSAGARFGQLSQVNQDNFGPCVEDDVEKIRKSIFKSLEEGGEEQIARVQRAVDQIYASSADWRLVKGKWVQSYLHHLVSGRHPAQATSGGGKKDLVTAACLPTLDYTQPWADYYRERFAGALADV